MDGFDDRAFIEAYKRLSGGKPHPSDRAIVQSVRDSLQAQGEDTAALDALLGTDWGAQASALTPSTEPSVADRVNAAQSMSMGVPAADPSVPPGTAPGNPIDWLANRGEGGNALTRQSGFGDIPPTTTDGAPDRAQQVIDAHAARGVPGVETTGPGDDIATEATTGPSGVRIAPDTGAVTPPQDFSAQGATQTLTPPGDAAVLGLTTNPLPDQGGGEDRRRGRDRGGRGGGTNWRAERDALGVGPDSAFAGVGEDFMIDYASSPDLAARAIAKRLGGGAQTAALIRPQVEAGLQLIQSGGFGGRRKELGPGQSSSAAQLALLEEYIRQGSGLGTSIDPRATVRSGLKRASRTPVEELQAGAENPSDPMSGLAQQIQTTHNALLAGAGQWGPGAAESLMAKLDAASLAWMEGVAAGTETQSYPEYLRTQGARRWIR